MRRFIVALITMFVGAPAVAVGWSADWLEDAPGPVEGSLVEPQPGGERYGEGWQRLDGWMRGDPLLRHWVTHRFDLDGDSWLSDEEGAMARRSFYAVADANDSGVISPDEFVAGWSSVRRELRRFYALDVG